MLATGVATELPPDVMSMNTGRGAVLKERETTAITTGSWPPFLTSSGTIPRDAFFCPMSAQHPRNASSRMCTLPSDSHAAFALSCSAACASSCTAMQTMVPSGNA